MWFMFFFYNRTICRVYQFRQKICRVRADIVDYQNRMKIWIACGGAVTEYMQLFCRCFWLMLTTDMDQTPTKEIEQDLNDDWPAKAPPFCWRKILSAVIIQSVVNQFQIWMWSYHELPFRTRRPPLGDDVCVEGMSAKTVNHLPFFKFWILFSCKWLL